MTRDELGRSLRDRQQDLIAVLFEVDDRLARSIDDDFTDALLDRSESLAALEDLKRRMATLGGDAAALSGRWANDPREASGEERGVEAQRVGRLQDAGGEYLPFVVGVVAAHGSGNLSGTAGAAVRRSRSPPM